jgi:hypothetical protein
VNDTCVKTVHEGMMDRGFAVMQTDSLIRSIQ